METEETENIMPILDFQNIMELDIDKMSIIYDDNFCVEEFVEINSSTNSSRQEDNKGNTKKIEVISNNIYETQDKVQVDFVQK